MHSLGQIFLCLYIIFTSIKTIDCCDYIQERCFLFCMKTIQFNIVLENHTPSSDFHLTYFFYF